MKKTIRQQVKEAVNLVMATDGTDLYFYIIGKDDPQGLSPLDVVETEAEARQWIAGIKAQKGLTYKPVVLDVISGEVVANP